MIWDVANADGVAFEEVVRRIFDVDTISAVAGNNVVQEVVGAGVLDEHAEVGVGEWPALHVFRADEVAFDQVVAARVRDA